MGKTHPRSSRHLGRLLVSEPSNTLEVVPITQIIHNPPSLCSAPPNKSLRAPREPQTSPVRLPIQTSSSRVYGLGEVEPHLPLPTPQPTHNRNPQASQLFRARYYYRPSHPLPTVVAQPSVLHRHHRRPHRRLPNGPELSHIHRVCTIISILRL